MWSKKDEKIFREIKEIWEKDLALRIPDPKVTYTLESDASNIGLGATLKQNGVPIEHISRTLRGAENNYSSTEKEALAAIWAMEKPELNLSGNELVLITDHKPLESIRVKKEFGTSRI